MTVAPRVLALVTDAYGGRGGIAQYNRDFLGASLASGVVSHVTVLPRGAPDTFGSPAGVDQARPRRGRIAYTLATLVWALGHPVDVVWCGHLYMAPLALLVARWRRAKLVIQTHGIEAWLPPGRFRRIALEAADLVLCVSRYTAGQVRGWACLAPERILVLSNTVGDRFEPGDEKTLRRDWGLQGRRVLLTVGRMDARERYKGHERVIAALPQLLALGHDVVYVVAGEGDDVERLRAVAAEQRLTDRVRFIGALSPDQLPDAYRAADVFVMPSTGEGFGIAFLEAMACGTPAVGLAAGGATDALGDGELGAAVAEADLTDTLARMLDAPRPDPRALSAAVKARFGRRPFEARARAALLRLLEAA